MHLKKWDGGHLYQLGRDDFDHKNNIVYFSYSYAAGSRNSFRTILQYLHVVLPSKSGFVWREIMWYYCKRRLGF